MNTDRHSYADAKQMDIDTYSYIHRKIHATDTCGQMCVHTYMFIDIHTPIYSYTHIH